jgi:Fic family protein
MRRDDIAPDRQQYLVRAHGHPHVWALTAPPTPRRLNLKPGHDRGFAAAHQALGRLAAALSRIPNVDMVTRTLARREAVMSSQIEGTRSDLPQLLVYEATHGVGDLPPDVRVTQRYVEALARGLDAIRTQGRAGLTLGLLDELHALLMRDDADRIPIGVYRRGQVWVGAGRLEDAIIVPGPPDSVPPAMAEFAENVLSYAPREDEFGELNLLARLAIAHAQFETIHPYADGNGRVGRLLLPLMLASEGLPPLYLSGTLLDRKHEYYGALASVQLKGEWDDWVALLCRAVEESCDESIAIADALLGLAERWEHSLKALRRDSAARRLPRFLIGHPVLTVQQAAQGLDVSIPAANAAMNRLLAAGIVELVNERQWGRLFRAREVLETLDRRARPDR